MANKQLKDEELKKVQDLNQRFLQAKIKIADIVINLFNTVPAVDAIQEQFSDLEKELIKEYGENAVIDLRTGEVKDPETPVENGENK
jgi:hypothetical protein|tara:strand:- start:2714 stop:2974 length:261 start_codon:yes stop_codon:yes gene_type:complete